MLGWESRVLSYWEQQSLQKVDFVVVGAGLIGMQTALALRLRAPEARIVILERHAPPRGAGTQNAGFACFGSPGELLDDIERVGRDAALALVERRWRGLQALRAQHGDTVLQIEDHCGHEVLTRDSAVDAAALEDLNSDLRRIFGEEVFRLRPDLLLRYGFAREHVAALVHTRFEAALDSGRLSLSLQRQLRAADIELLCGIEVGRLECRDYGVDVCAVDTSGEEIMFHARSAALCANAALPDLLRTLGSAATAALPDIRPGRGQVLVTDTVPDLKFSGTFHADRGFVYFRRLGDRVLLGGGRNRDFDAESTQQRGLNQSIQTFLDEYLRTVILPGTQVPISLRWSGIMAFTADKQPCVKQIAPGCVVGFACNGMGVALSAAAAEQCADCVIQAAES